MSEPDNLVPAHLRELRAEMGSLRSELGDVRNAMERRFDAMQEQGMRALRTFIGFRGRSDRAFGSVEMQLESLERRVKTLEDARA